MAPPGPCRWGAFGGREWRLEGRGNSLPPTPLTHPGSAGSHPPLPTGAGGEDAALWGGQSPSGVGIRSQRWSEGSHFLPGGALLGGGEGLRASEGVLNKGCCAHGCLSVLERGRSVGCGCEMDSGGEGGSGPCPPGAQAPQGLGGIPRDLGIRQPGVWVPPEERSWFSVSLHLPSLGLGDRGGAPSRRGITRPRVPPWGQW